MATAVCPSGDSVSPNGISRVCVELSVCRFNFCMVSFRSLVFRTDTLANLFPACGFARSVYRTRVHKIPLTNSSHTPIATQFTTPALAYFVAILRRFSSQWKCCLGTPMFFGDTSFQSPPVGTSPLAILTFAIAFPSATTHLFLHRRFTST